MGPVDVAIVGGGASGTLVAVQLLRQARGPWRIALIERTGALARGVAYGPAEPCHLLNVPAAGMSALPDDPDHFVRWSGAAADAFVPRAVYGAYLEALLTSAHAAAAPGVTLQLVCGEAASATVDGGGVRIALREGGEIEARAAVLALGNLIGPDLQVPDGGLYSGPLYRRSPWQAGALDGIARDGSVLLLGTGLTMVDAALALQRRGHRGTIHALSRHGLLPHVHDDASGPAQPRIGAVGVRGLLRALRAASQRGGDWRAPLDALRPVAQRIWSRLSHEERCRFLRHLRPYWDVHRHRMAPGVGAAIARLRTRDRLHVHTGRVQCFTVEGGCAVALYRPRGERQTRELRVARVINCTGPATQLRDVRHALVDSLLAQGLARPDALGMGFATDRDGALLGAAPGLLFTLGTLRRGELWETTSIPELRSQARAVAQRLVSDLALPSAAQASV
ncbi:MAG: FAD/NAD(P)-binding protein [Myxococcales bacterium]